MRRGRIGRLLAVLAAGWMTGAQAGDVTYAFNVPVQLQQMPTALFDKLAVVCNVEAPPETLASGMVEVAVDAGGNVQTTLAVPVTLAESAAMRARLWRCQVQANVGGRGWRIPQGFAFQPVAGSTARLEVMGELR